MSANNNNGRRVDDGSQEWFDQLARNRIRGNSDPYSQYRGMTQSIQEIDINQVTDPELRRRLLLAKEAGVAAREHYVKAPHFGPAHLGGKPVDRVTASNYTIDADMDQLSSTIQARHMQIKQSINEVDSADEQLARIPMHLRQKAAATINTLAQGNRAFNASLTMLNEVGSTNTFQHQQPQQPQQQVTSCKLVDGFPCFRAVQTGPYPGLESIVLARAVGQIVPQVSMHEFVVKRVVDVFVVPPQQQTINTAVINSNPQLRTQLVEVLAPPMSGIGTLLVPKEALGLRGGMGNQRGILTDSTMRQPQHPNQGLLLNNYSRPTPVANTQHQNRGLFPTSTNSKGLLKG